MSVQPGTNLDSVNQLLECPVCFNSMEPPIEMCKNGHNFCSACKPQLKECPICKGAFSNVRNRALESIAENMLHPCDNAKFGCTATFTRADLNKHSKICPFEPLKCLPYKDSGCKWRGTMSELYDHMTTSHQNCLVYEKFPMKLHFSLHVAMNGTRLAKVNDDLFWVFLQQEPENSKYFRAVQYLGKPENASKYAYCFDMELSDDVGTGLSYRRNVYSMKDNIEEEYKNNETLSNLLKFIKLCGYEKKSIVYTFNIQEVEVKSENI